jgi:hypothetical protein
VVEPWDDPAIAREDSWRHELWVGLGWRPEARRWLIRPWELAPRCAPPARCFVVARARDVAELQAAVRLEVLETQGHAVLLATPAVTAEGTPAAGH